MDEVEEVLSYLAKNPTESEILAAVYKVKTKNRYKSDDDFDEDSFNQLPTEVGGLEPVMGLPEELMKHRNWAEELSAKYRKAMARA